jgi:hypothetical protein
VLNSDMLCYVLFESMCPFCAILLVGGGWRHNAGAAYGDAQKIEEVGSS